MKIVLKEAELKKPCEKVEDVLGDGMAISDTLFSVLDKEPGIGLAANQIGINKQVCVISVPRKDPEDGKTIHFRRTFINPIIVEKKDPFIFTKEGCLSFPGSWVETIRFYEVIVKCDLNKEGILLKGLEAVCAQHEVDHLNGITMYDRRKQKYGVNGPCPCESGKKYKKCCSNLIKEREIL